MRKLIWPPVLAALFLASCGGRHNHPNGKQVIVIGVDGMDPGFVERHWADLPNLAKLRDRGSFTRLATTTPPESPVAWSTFITGLDPAQHGIFDFVHRDPATYQLFLSMSGTTEARFRIALGPWEIPLSRSHAVLYRKGKAFWETLEEHGIPATIIRMPVNYPPVASGNGLAGMGTPDLAGTEGTFTYFTNDPGDPPRSVSGGIVSRADVQNGRAILRLAGPPNSLRRDHRPATSEITVDIDPKLPLARLSIGDSLAIVREGEWSDWLPIDFALIPHLASAHGMVRVYAKQLHPRLELYVSPINVDPESPDLPISTPGSFSRTIANDIGRFYTLGIPEDTSALRQGIFDLPEFLGQSRLVLADERKLLDWSLDRFRLDHSGAGLFFFYFSSVDQNSHMLWGQHDDELLKIYQQVDAVIGEVMHRNPAAELMVMSDHGFASFDRSVDLNTWLYHEGLLQVNESGQIDFHRTKAYALGLNSVYADHEVIERVRSGILAMSDPANGRAPIKTVTETHVAGPNARVAPDLIVGYAPGYRVSWQSANGSLSNAIFEDNTDPWIADHCINAADVPGVLFTSRKIEPDNPNLKDLPVSILALYGINPEPQMTGHSIYAHEN